MATPLAPFPPSWASTSLALHDYARVAGAIPRAHAKPHPHWWHVGLVIEGDALVTEAISLPGGGTLRLGVSPPGSTLWMRTTSGFHADFPLDAGPTANDLAARVLASAGALGLADDYDRSRFASDERHAYDPQAAAAYWHNLTAVASVFEQRRAEMVDAGPLHVWPHHFDASFEWYGTRRVPDDEGGDAPAQINLGLNVLGEQYIYSSPWPFDEALLGEPLPAPGRWHTEGWTGSVLPFEAIVGDDAWDERVLEFARAVFAAARPTLTA